MVHTFYLLQHLYLDKSPDFMKVLFKKKKNRKVELILAIERVTV